MKASILSIGTELTRGELINTNAAWLAEELTLLGVNAPLHVTIDDDESHIVSTLRMLAASHDWIICTGGLGPTSDDITALSAAKAMDVPLLTHDGALKEIAAFFESRGRPMSPSNAKQANLPEGALHLSNPVGTAPGFKITLGSCTAFFMPGVPFEMKRMFNDHIRPELEKRTVQTQHQIRLRTFGLPESVVGEKLADIEKAYPQITMGYRATFPEIEVKVLARQTTAAEAQALCEHVTTLVKNELADVLFAEGTGSYAEAISQAIAKDNVHVALAESCTAGLASSMLGAVPGISKHFLASFITYSNESKASLLGVTQDILQVHGAVSEACALAMAQGALRNSGADRTASVTGIAGPDGGSTDKPVGTVWFGYADHNTSFAFKRHLPFGDRTRNRTAAAYVALGVLAWPDRYRFQHRKPS